jgi:hypothetical protein
MSPVAQKVVEGIEDTEILKSMIKLLDSRIETLERLCEIKEKRNTLLEKQIKRLTAKEKEQ